MQAPPPTPVFKKTCPCTILPPPFFNFSDPPSREGNQNLLPPPFKKGGGEGDPNYVISVSTVFNVINSIHLHKTHYIHIYDLQPIVLS